MSGGWLCIDGVCMPLSDVEVDAETNSRDRMAKYNVERANKNKSINVTWLPHRYIHLTIM